MINCKRWYLLPKLATTLLFIGIVTSTLNVTLSEIIFPSAHAKGAATSPLKWDGKDGELFELEITTEDQTKPILTKQLKKNSFDFIIPGPGIYTWRVRQQKNDKWSPFSPFTEILAEDKVNQLEKPLMKKSSVKGDEFTFEWEEPFPDFKYILSIYRGKNKTPIKSLPVKGGIKIIKLKKDQDKIYWSVSAESVYGNKSKDQKKFLVPDSSLILEQPENSSAPLKNQYILRFGYQNFSNSYKQSAGDASLSSSNKSDSLTGPAINIRGEAWRGNYGLIAAVKSITLSSNDTDYTETEFVGELGHKLKQSELSSHILAAGFYYGAANIQFSNVDADYTKYFVTLRHQYDRKLSERFSTTIETTLLQSAQFEFIPPSFRIYPMLNWHFGPSWWLSLQAGYEYNKSNLDYNLSGTSGKLDFQSRIIVYGLQLNWKNF